MPSNMAVSCTKLRRLVILLLTLVSLQFVDARKHHLKLEDDSRPQFTLSSFGFLKQGALMVNVTNFVFSQSKHKISNTTFGFTLDVSSSSGAGGYMEDYADKCILKDMGGNPGDVKDEVLSIVFIRMDFSRNKLLIERRGKAMQNLIITNQTMEQFWKSRNIVRREAREDNSVQLMSDSYLFPKTKRSVRERRAFTDPPPAKNQDLKGKKIDDTAEAKESAETGTVPTKNDNMVAEANNGDHSIPKEASIDNSVILTELPLYGTPKEFYSFFFLVAVTEDEQEGMYNLNFHNCLNSDESGNTKISLTVDLEENNQGNYLSAGSMPLPTLYFFLSFIYLVVAIIWNTVLCKSKESVFKMHYLMLTVVFVKSLSCLFHAMNYHFIQLEGIHEEAWAVLFYIAYLTRGALLFITIILIGSGWAFIKHVLSDKEKKLFLIVIPLQILDNIAWIIVEESEEGQSQYTIWKEIFILIDLLCCGAILFPVVWSIRHLQEASKADGKAELSITKLKLFRQFYIMVVCYIYFTRIIVYLLKMTVPFKYEWLNELFKELATILFFVVTGSKFRPATDNPYLQVPSEDEEDIEMDQVIVGKSAALETLKKVNQGNQGNSEEQTAVKLRESSHEYD